MKPQVSCFNTKAFVDYVRAKNPENLHFLWEAVSDQVPAGNDPELFLTDPNNWISVDMTKHVITQTKKATGDELAVYKAAFESVRLRKLGYIEKILVRALLTPKHAIRNAPKINDKFNKGTKTVEIVESSNTHAIVRLHWVKDIALTKDFCLMNKGVYEAMATIWDLPPARLEERTCFFEGGPYCEYEMWWNKKSLWRLIFRKRGIRREILDSLIKEMESDKALLQKKYDQVSKLNVELEKKVASLMSLQEASQAVVSILDEQSLIQTIMNLLTWVIGFERALLFLADEKQEKLLFAQAVGTVKDLLDPLRGYQIPLDRMTNILARVASTGVPKFVKDVQSSNLRKGNVILNLFRPENFAVAPLIARNKVIGVLAGEFPPDKANMSESDLNLLMTFSNHIAIAIENARLYRDLEKTYRTSLQAQKMEAIGTLAGGIAHDFNNILQAILGNTSLLMYDLDDQRSDQSDKLKQIEVSAQRATGLVRQLLTFSKKGESHQPRPLSLNLEAREVKELLSSTIPKMIAIELDLDPKLRTVEADPVQVNQVLMNLAVNARDAMPDGGKLVIGTKNITLDEAFCRSHAGLTPGEHVLLWVSDTGEGIKQQVIDHIFEPFFTTKAPGKGTGLGLSTVYGIVKTHKGHITCKSATNCGTTFEIYFPTLPRAEKEIKAQRPKDLSAMRGSETVLFVDDEKPTLTYARELLARYGYKVLVAETGEDALGIFTQEKDHIDLVILDLIMPGMGGKRCLIEILKIDPQARVVVATGYASGALIREALIAGAKDVLAKPFQAQEMIDIIRRVMDQLPGRPKVSSRPARAGLRVVTSK
jgi:signal transduction histidine kinase/CheY-like chemotaxis protein